VKFSGAAANAIFIRSTQIRDKVLIDFDPLAKLNACRVKYFQDAYIEIAKA